jgi:hypothetical protein
MIPARHGEFDECVREVYRATVNGQATPYQVRTSAIPSREIEFEASRLA